MGQDFFTYLPAEITIDILSRLPVQTAIRCKCVRKSWRNLIETPEFVKSYKSFPSLAISRGEAIPNPYLIFDLEDELSHENNSNSSSCKEAFNFDFPHLVPIHSSVHGLLFLCHKLGSRSERRYDDLFVCNPVTREYINLPNPQPGLTIWWSQWSQFDSFGFGVSKTSGQYKLVRVFHKVVEISDGRIRLVRDGPHCQVYTLGTGSWRSINVPSNIIFMYDINDPLRGAFLNGNHYWLAASERCQWISCFDLESEIFTIVSLPPNLDVGPKSQSFRSLFALTDYSLCLCDAKPDHEIAIWLMKEYGDDKSWTKQYVIPKIGSLSRWHVSVHVIKLFKEDGVLIIHKGFPKIVCYSNKTETLTERYLIERSGFSCSSAVCYTPSFLQLKALFLMENVRSF